MNFYINNKKFTCFFLFVLWSLSLCSLGCSSMPWQKQTLVSYQVMGETLKSSKVVLIELCLNGTLSEKDCSEARDAYNQAVDVYKVLGNQAIIAMDIGSDTIYKSMARHLMALLADLAKYQEVALE